MWIIPPEQLAFVRHKPRAEGKEWRWQGSCICGSETESLRTPGECVCDSAHHCLSLRPVNWNTKHSGVDGRVLVDGGGALSVSTFAAGWESTGEPASATDTLSLVKWTVTLHFSTCWRRRSGRFEPCDVTLIEFWFSPCCLLLLLLGS